MQGQTHASSENEKSDRTTIAIGPDSPTPASPQMRGLVSQLHAALTSSGYLEVARIPSGKNRFAIPIEPINLWHFLVRRQPRIMYPTAIPEFYRWLQRLKNRNLERQFALFGLSEALPSDQIEEALSQLKGAPTLTELADAGLLEATKDPNRLRCRVRFLPVDDFLIAVDPVTEGLDYVYFGRDSWFLAQRMRLKLFGRTFKTGLDLCCGAGIQGLTISKFAETVHGTDVNPRAVDYANMNAEFCGVSDRVHFSTGNLANALDGPYELIVANPPFVWMPTEMGKTNRVGFGGEYGLEITNRILAELDRLLDKHGEAHFIAESPIIDGRSLLFESTEKILSGTNLGAVITPCMYAVDSRFVPFYRSQGCSMIIHYHVHVGRDVPTGVQVDRMPLPSHIMHLAFVKLKYLLAR